MQPGSDRAPRGADDGARGRPSASSARERLAAFASAPWLRAPVLLFAFPGLLVAVVAATLILSIASASSPLFVSSAGNATLRNGLSGQVCPYTTALQVSSFGPLSVPRSTQGAPATGDLYARRDVLMRRATSSFPELAPAVHTIVGPAVAVLGAHGGGQARLMARDGQLAHVEVLSRGASNGQGIWLADTTAKRLDARPGSRVTLRTTDGLSTVLPVAGVFRDPARRPPEVFWCSMTDFIFQSNAFGTFVPPPLALVTPATMGSLGARLHLLDVQATWEYPLRGRVTLPEAQSLGAAVGALGDKLRTQDPSSPYTIFGFPEVQTELTSVAEQATATVATVRGPVGTIAIAGRVVALLVIAAAGVYWVERRRVEVGLLNARGVGPVALATKVLLEAAVPVAASAAGGLLLSEWLVRRLGPSPEVDASALRSATVQVALTAAIAWLLLGVVAAASARRAAEAGSARGASAVARAPWELAVLALAAAAFYEIRTRGGTPVSATPGGPAEVDALLLLFPVLFLAGAAGLAARLLRRALPRLRGSGSRTPAVYLASRRLAGATTVAVGLITATALSIGILAYAGTLATSARASARAKALVFVGSDVQAVVEPGASPPRGFPFPYTRVVQVTTATLLPGVGAVNAVGVDPVTFARAVHWDGSFSRTPLRSLLASLRPGPQGTRVPVIVAGPAPPANATLGLLGGANALLPARVAATTTAFPGMEQGRATVAFDVRLLRRYPSLSRTEVLLIKGDPAAIERALSAGHVATQSVVSAAEVSTATPVFLSLSWIFEFLQALGVLTGLIALGGTVLYLESRQRSREVSYALSRRMGLRAGAHRVSVLLELGGMLVTGFVLGAALSWIAARLVYAKLDPQPTLPPPALFRSPLSLFALTLAALLFVALAGSVLVQRAADRANVAEVLRVAG